MCKSFQGPPDSRQTNHYKNDADNKGKEKTNRETFYSKENTLLNIFIQGPYTSRTYIIL